MEFKNLNSGLHYYLTVLISQKLIPHEEYIKHTQGLTKNNEESVAFVEEKLDLINWNKELMK